MDAIETHSTRASVERLFARGFVIAGGLFWIIASFAALWAYEGRGASVALLAAFYPFAAAAAALAIGWYFERTAAVLLALGSLAVIVWGVVANWEMGVWVLMMIFMVGPMLTAAFLYSLARREQTAADHARAAAGQLVPVNAESQLP